MNNSTRTTSIDNYMFTDLVALTGDDVHRASHFEPLGILSQHEINEAEEQGKIYHRIPYTSYGDYHGSTVERANNASFLLEFGHIPGVVEMSAFPGGSELLVKISTLEQSPEGEELLSAIHSLKDYPVYDDEMLQLVEDEIWGESTVDHFGDAARALDQRFNDSSLVEGTLNSADSDVIQQNLLMLGDDLGVYPEFESAISVYFDVERIIKRASTEQIETLLGLDKGLLSTPTLPPLSDVVRALEYIKESHIASITHMVDDEDEDDCLYLDVTLATDTAPGNNPDKWAIQTGDNSFTGGAYSYPDWAVSSVGPDTDCEDLAKELISQLEELACQ